MTACKPHTIGEKDAVVEHGKCRHEQTPDTITHIVAVDLGAGSKAAAKMCRKPDKSHAEDNRRPADAGGRFFVHLSFRLPFVQLLHRSRQHFLCYPVWIMLHIGHFRDAADTFCPLFLCELDLRKRGGKPKLFV